MIEEEHNQRCLRAQADGIVSGEASIATSLIIEYIIRNPELNPWIDDHHRKLLTEFNSALSQHFTITCLPLED